MVEYCNHFVYGTSPDRQAQCSMMIQSVVLKESFLIRFEVLTTLIAMLIFSPLGNIELGQDRRWSIDWERRQNNNQCVYQCLNLLYPSVFLCLHEEHSCVKVSVTALIVTCYLQIILNGTILANDFTVLVHLTVLLEWINGNNCQYTLTVCVHIYTMYLLPTVDKGTSLQEKANMYTITLLVNSEYICCVCS